MSSEIWKIEKNLCRCCHTEGTFKSLGMPCEEQGLQMYCDMLLDCFDVNLTQVDGPIGLVTYTICDACILRLQDAYIFKKQVRCCEDRFIELYKNNVIKVEIKEEVISPCDDRLGDCHNSDDFIAFEPEDNFQVTVKVEYAEEPKRKTRGKHKKQKRKSGKDSDVKKVNKPDQEPPSEKPKKSRQRGTRLVDCYSVHEGNYSCNECNRSYASRPLVSQHYRFVHLKRRRPKGRKCPKCDERITENARAFHLETYHGIPAPSCGVCGRKFRYPCHLLVHQKKVHMAEKMATCQICNKGFFNETNLKLHMAAHSDVRRFKCETCAREFRWENNLKDHLKMHSGDRRYVCKVCDKPFVQKSKLKRHGARNHPGVDVS